MPGNFDLAPPAKAVDGLLAVPIDISAITATIVFDTAAQVASADATITYELGPTAGHPIFDLRQNPAEAWLDGAPFPVAQLAHHDFGSGSFTNLRIIESAQAAGSVHQLRVTYALAMPDAQLGGSYLPALDWLPGPRLRFVFGLSDLNRARYAEAWLPANLPFDQYAITLALQVTGTLVPHQVISNATVTTLGTNHWQLDFPSRFSSLSPLLEIRAADALERHDGATVLPVSGAAVAIETWKPAGSTINLATQATAIADRLAHNENLIGPYLHGNRFVAFFNGGGMEYEGGTTTATSALAHEIFHSWFARGVKPASQADGWWDEGMARFHDQGADDAEPFDFGDPPVLLCTRDPWQRHTVGNAYADGSRFWRGMASLLGVAGFNNLMSQWYAQFKGKPASTALLEEFLLAKSGNPDVVDAFHRFVYGFADAAPDLWLRDDPGHTGSDAWGGTFWDSPDLWIRRADDGGTLHQQPEYGQDNWFHARVRNRSPGSAAQHFVVSFHARGFAGTQFSWPADFLPCLAAKAEFELPAGGERIVKARWPAALVPPAGTHTCLLASVIVRGDRPGAGTHVWEHNNLAQKNLTVVDLLPGEYFILPVVVARRIAGLGARFDLEVWRRAPDDEIRLSLLHRTPDFFRHLKGAKLRRFEPGREAERQPAFELDCGGPMPGGHRHDPKALLGSADPQRVAERFGQAWELPLQAAERVRVPVELPAGQQVLGLRVAVDAKARPRQTQRLHLVQRHRKSGQIVGGVAIELRIIDGREKPRDG